MKVLMMVALLVDRLAEMKVVLMVARKVGMKA